MSLLNHQRILQIGDDGRFVTDYKTKQQFKVKTGKNCFFINAFGEKIYITKKDFESKNERLNDPLFQYIFEGEFKKNPCHAMNYWNYRNRLGHKITPAQYKIKFKIGKD